MTNYVKTGGLKVADVLYNFINEDVIPGTGVNPNQFWSDLEQLITDLTPENWGLLARREKLQSQINEWHQQNNKNFEFTQYKAFLKEIEYLEPEVEDFQVSTETVDEEIALQAGPQLVVPVNNARYALNAANARWGSLYDALYGSDAISEEDGAEKGTDYNPVRGKNVVQFAKQFLDQAVPLKGHSHEEAEAYVIEQGALQIQLTNGKTTTLENSQWLAGYHGNSESPSAVLLKHNGIHLEIQIERAHPIGKTDVAGIKDILMEAALTTIIDCEDSVAAVDAEDKVLVYRNWLGLMKGDLTSTFQKGNQTIERKLNPDREYISPSGGKLTLPGRSLMFVRNVGHLMTNNAVLDHNGDEVFEGILDAVFTSLIAKHDLLGNGMYSNSNKGSIYIVKPKMHGSKEAAYSNTLFNRVEDMLGLERHTIKIGVMDEERRMSLNLKNSIYEVKERIAFINTGFLDRTGDEIHTSMEAGVMIRKNEMKSSGWLTAYEQSNVLVGLASGLQGRAQIGKGMWAMPDLMKEMMEQKIAHLQAGANTAWVPSPTAAVLHAIHYHQIHVTEVQNKLKQQIEDKRDEILQIPIVTQTNWTAEEIQQELDNNAQGILGYVVRWVEQGIGCSKVLDINNVGLMEDRATLRISSQHMANWLYQGIVSEEQVLETMKRMAKIVDGQNAADAIYRPMAPDYDASIAFQAACDLVFKGTEQPGGYTEPILHQRRIEAKQKLSL